MASKPLAFKISVKPCYLAKQSEPNKKKFVWSYEIKITNQCDDIVQLLNRFWRITDMSGAIEEIRGVGVVGLQPLIMPGKTFSYTSFCQLTMPQGTMEGYYEMQDLNEQLFSIDIPKFILSAPASITKPFQSLLH